MQACQPRLEVPRRGYWHCVTGTSSVFAASPEGDLEIPVCVLVE